MTCYQLLLCLCCFCYFLRVCIQFNILSCVCVARKVVLYLVRLFCFVYLVTEMQLLLSAVVFVFVSFLLLLCGMALICSSSHHYLSSSPIPILPFPSCINFPFCRLFRFSSRLFPLHSVQSYSFQSKHYTISRFLSPFLLSSRLFTFLFLSSSYLLFYFLQSFLFQPLPFPSFPLSCFPFPSIPLSTLPSLSFPSSSFSFFPSPHIFCCYDCSCCCVVCYYYSYQGFDTAASS